MLCEETVPARAEFLIRDKIHHVSFIKKLIAVIVGAWILGSAAVIPFMPGVIFKNPDQLSMLALITGPLGMIMGGFIGLYFVDRSALSFGRILGIILGGIISVFLVVRFPTAFSSTFLFFLAMFAPPLCGAFLMHSRS